MHLAGVKPIDVDLDRVGIGAFDTKDSTKRTVVAELIFEVGRCGGDYVAMNIESFLFEATPNCDLDWQLCEAIHQI